MELAQSMIRQVVMYFSMVRRRACWASLVKWSTSVITTTLNSLSLVVVVICCAELNKVEKNIVKSNSTYQRLLSKQSIDLSNVQDKLLKMEFLINTDFNLKSTDHCS